MMRILIDVVIFLLGAFFGPSLLSMVGIGKKA